MKITTLLTAALFSAVSFPILAMQPPAAAEPAAPAASPTSPQSTQQPATAPETPASPVAAPQEQPSAASAGAAAADATAESTAPAAQPVDLKPVSAELVSKLDSKTAKAGDDVVIETRSEVKTADGTEIPKGSKLTGHVIAVQASGDSSPNSQVAVKIDQAELKGGQKVAIHSEIQSLGAAESAGDASAGGASAADRSSAAANPDAASSAAGSGGGMNGAGATAGNSAANGAGSGAAGYAPGYTPGTTANSPPAAGTIVARNGHIAIRTTSVPGVLLANNAPGEQDPRMTQASGILLGARKDVELETGTKLVVGVSTAAAGSDAAQGAGSAGTPSAAK